jgi:hypothetical protein
MLTIIYNHALSAKSSNRTEREGVTESGGNTRLIAPALANLGSHMVGWHLIVNLKWVAHRACDDQLGQRG